MEEQFESLIEIVKKQPIKGCITGSILLGYFFEEESLQDVDVFVYDDKSFQKLLFFCHHSPLFHILDPLEQWKFDQYINRNDTSINKIGLVTIKFMYNLTIPLNITIKKNCTNILSVLSSFDMDIICNGFDIETQQYLDLTYGSTITKVANYNRWNPHFKSNEIWQISRLLRQSERVFKYSKRNINTDNMAKLYIELADKVQEHNSIFSNAVSYNESLNNTKKNAIIIKEILNVWLVTHTLSKKEQELLKTKINLI
jgi:hypothetical protein